MKVAEEKSQLLNYSQIDSSLHLDATHTHTPFSKSPCLLTKHRLRFSVCLTECCSCPHRLSGAAFRVRALGLQHTQAILESLQRDAQFAWGLQRCLDTREASTAGVAVVMAILELYLNLRTQQHSLLSGTNLRNNTSNSQIHK